jgi:hypothetical protein
MGREWLCSVEAVLAVLEAFPQGLIEGIRFEPDGHAAPDQVVYQALLALVVPGVVDDRAVPLAHVPLALVLRDLVHRLSLFGPSNPTARP